MRQRLLGPTGGVPTTKMAQLDLVSVDSLIKMNLVDIHLQPIVELRSGVTYGQEGLCRCKIRELSTPLTLLTLALEQGAIGRLGRNLRERAIRAANGQRLFLNVHPDELDEEYLSRDDDPIFAHQGDVVLEIPESAQLVRYRYAHSTFSTLRKRGITVALDDFGSGYSNLGYIVNLAPEFVKLDRELIAGVRSGSRQQTLLASLNELCEAQGAHVIAEGIETEDELIAIRDAGIPLGQGFFLGRPSPTGAVTWHP